MKIAKKIFYQIISFTLAALCFTSCAKDEGKGGKAAIDGAIYYVVNNGDIVTDGLGGYKFAFDTIPAIDKSVFIVYGGGAGSYDDKAGTNGFGYFKFDYLREGNYMVYAVGDSADQKSAVYRNIKIGGSGTSSVAPIYLENGKNSKCAGLVGSIEAMYKDEDDYMPGIGLRVYIRNVNGGEQNDTRADKDGIFRFAKLQPNTYYEVWAESEDRKNMALKPAGYTIATSAAGSVMNYTASPIQVTVF